MMRFKATWEDGPQRHVLIRAEGEGESRVFEANTTTGRGEAPMGSAHCATEVTLTLVVDGAEMGAWFLREEHCPVPRAIALDVDEVAIADLCNVHFGWQCEQGLYVDIHWEDQPVRDADFWLDVRQVGRLTLEGDGTALLESRCHDPASPLGVHIHTEDREIGQLIDTSMCSKEAHVTMWIRGDAPEHSIECRP